MYDVPKKDYHQTQGKKCIEKDKDLINKRLHPLKLKKIQSTPTPVF